MKYDIVVIGGGPAGLVCAQYASRAGRKTAVVEEMACGGQTMIIDRIENYPAFGEISGYELAEKLENQAISFGCEIIYASATQIRKNSERDFSVITSEGSIECKAVVIATGSKHKELCVPGEKEYTGHGVSYCATCDGPFFKGKKILVCGGGDSACQESIYLSKLSPDVTVCHRRDEFRAQKSIVSAMLEAKVKTKMNELIVSVNGEDGKVSSVTFRKKMTGEEYTEKFDAVFVFVGNIPVTSMCPDCEKDENGFIVTDASMRTNIPGLFACGDVRNTPFRQIVTAAADGAVAAHCASEYIS